MFLITWKLQIAKTKFHLCKFHKILLLNPFEISRLKTSKTLGNSAWFFLGKSTWTLFLMNCEKFLHVIAFTLVVALDMLYPQPPVSAFFSGIIYLALFIAVNSFNTPGCIPWFVPYLRHFLRNIMYNLVHHIALLNIQFI